MATPRTNLSESRLARNLVERDLIAGDVIEQVFQTCTAGGRLLTEVLIEEGLMSDWELSRIACEAFNLPFMPVDVHAPSENALKDLDPEFLKRWCLVPLVRNDNLLTVAIPAAISPQTFDELSTMAKAELTIVIGSVLSSRQWLRENLDS